MWNGGEGTRRIPRRRNFSRRITGSLRPGYLACGLDSYSISLFALLARKRDIPAIARRRTRQRRDLGTYHHSISIAAGTSDDFGSTQEDSSQEHIYTALRCMLRPCTYRVVEAKALFEPPPEPLPAPASAWPQAFASFLFAWVNDVVSYER